MGDEWVRVRSVLAGWYPWVAAAFVVLALAGGVVAYQAHVKPPTATEQRVTSSWEASGEYTHQATVLRVNDVYPVGRILQNRTAYFARATPVLEGNYTFGYSAIRGVSGGQVDASVELVAVVRAVESQDEGEPTVLWRTSRTLNETNATLEPGERVSVPYAVNVTGLVGEADQVREQLGSDAGETRVGIVARVRTNGRIDGRVVEERYSHELPLTASQGLYRVGDGGPFTDRTEQTETVTVRSPPGATQTVGGPLLLLVGVAGAAGVVAAGRTGRLEPTVDERERLSFRSDRSEFDEWITAMTVPEAVLNGPRVEAESLADLVDFAIDTNEGVLHDESRGAFFVLRDDAVYAYEPPRVVVEADEAASSDGELDGGDRRSESGAGRGGLLSRVVGDGAPDGDGDETAPRRGSDCDVHVDDEEDGAGDGETDESRGGSPDEGGDPSEDRRDGRGESASE
jgi:hypothetical protein